MVPETKITPLFCGNNAFFALGIYRLTNLLWHTLKIAQKSMFFKEIFRRRIKTL